MRLIEHVLANCLDGSVVERLHDLEHRGQLDRLVLQNAEIQRRRFRKRTVKGEEVAIALPREQSLHNGAVLVLDPDYALVVEVAETSWLRCIPNDITSALELAYNAGNLHWRVKFDGAALLVAQEAPVEAYRARLRRLLDAGAVSVESVSADRAC